MVWKRQKAYVPNAPVAPRVKTWFLASTITLIFSLLLFVLHASNKLYLFQHITIWYVAIAPIIFLIIVFCVRGYLFGRELSKYDFLLNEARIAQYQWQNWAERYMAVVGEYILLPDNITTLNFVQNPKDFLSQNGFAKRINSVSGQPDVTPLAISLLLKNIDEQISLLPIEIMLNVTILTDDYAGNQNQLRDIFFDCWTKTIQSRAAPQCIHMESSLPYEYIDSWLKEPRTEVDLLLVLQLNGEDNYSDGLGVFLLAADDVALKYQLPVSGRLLRPMVIEINSFENDLILFMENQVLAQKAKGILADTKQFTSLTSKVLPITTIFGSALTTENILIQEKFTGIPGPFSEWLSAGLSLEIARQQSTPYLVFVQVKQHWLISTISPGSNNEII